MAFRRRAFNRPGGADPGDCCLAQTSFVTLAACAVLHEKENIIGCCYSAVLCMGRFTGLCTCAFFAFQSGERLQTHIENRGGLDG